MDHGGAYGNLKIDQNEVRIAGLSIEPGEHAATTTGARIIAREVNGSTELVWKTAGGEEQVTGLSAPNARVRGVFDRTESTISWDGPNRTITISPVGTSYSFVSGGTNFIKSASLQYQIANVTGTHWIYYGADGNLTELVNGSNSEVLAMLLVQSPVALVVWHTTDGTILFADERHGQGMPPETHLALHKSVGARLSRVASGYAAVTLGLVDGSGNLATSAQIAVAASNLEDEDVEHIGNAVGVASPFSPAQIPVIYRSGAAGDWRTLALTDYPLVYGGHGLTAGARIGYNLFSGGTWSLAEVPSTDFAVYHLFRWNDSTHPYVMIPGQASYGTVGAARVGAEDELRQLRLDGLPSPEFKSIASLIAETQSSYSNASKSRWRTTDSGANFVDWRYQND